MCRKMGMVSKSSEYGDRRRLSVYKTKKKQGPNKEEETTTSLVFLEETRNVLRDLFTQYPPNDGELGECKLENDSGKADKGQWKQESSFCKPSMSKADIAKKLELYASRMNEVSQLKKVAQDKAKLPIASYKDVISSTLKSHQFKFAVDLNDENIWRWVDDKMGKLYKGWRAKLHKHYKKLAAQDLMVARATPPPSKLFGEKRKIEWHYLVDTMYTNELYKKACTANAANRQKVVVPHCGGSRSMCS